MVVVQRKPIKQTPVAILPNKIFALSSAQLFKETETTENLKEQETITVNDLILNYSFYLYFDTKEKKKRKKNFYLFNLMGVGVVHFFVIFVVFVF